MENLEFSNDFYDDVIQRSESVYGEIRAEIGNDVLDSLINAFG